MYKFLTISLFLSLFIGCNKDEDEIFDGTAETPTETTKSVDENKDGKLNILILGTSQSINSGYNGFASDKIAQELEKILKQDESLDLEIKVSSENIYKAKAVEYGLGGRGDKYTANYYTHSLTQYYYWPDGQTQRWNNLSNQTDNKWDYVIIGADPYIVEKLPGYFALGVNKIASKVEEGGGKPMLLMVWPEDKKTTTPIAHFEEFAYRAANGAKTALTTIPAGLAWQRLTSGKKDTSTQHPSPNGAYLSAASIYSELFDRSAEKSNYVFDNELAAIAFSSKTSEESKIHYTGNRNFISPFAGCDISNSTITYNQTGSSSEGGILGGLNHVFNKSSKNLKNSVTAPISFNFGRANKNFEASKQYKIDPTKFNFSFGFPMQDHGNTGNTSMLYGIDKRYDGDYKETDLGVGVFMVKNLQLPYGRAIPIRTLYAQLKEAIPSFSAYKDGWHMSSDLDIASGAFIYTLLTGECVLGSEPTNINSSEWQSWMAQKIGHDTAYTLMTLKASPQTCN
jgi:hypothetical protein